MAILTNSGRIAMTISVKTQPIHLAWGSGSAAWDTAPVPESFEHIQKFDCVQSHVLI